MKKQTFWNWFEKNGIMSNLLSGAILTAGGALVGLVVEKTVDNPMVSIIAAIVSTTVAIAASWLFYWRFHSGEKFWAGECRLAAPLQSRIDGNKFFVSGFEKERQKLQKWLDSWSNARPEGTGGRGLSDLCIVTGEKNVGRSSIVLHVGLSRGRGACASNNDSVLYMSQGFQRDPDETVEQSRKEWSRALVKWVKATSPKSKYIVLISSRNIGLEDVMPAKERADDLHRRICFILKDPKLGSAENASLPKTFDIHELTPEECLSFLYKYAVKTGRLEEYAELKEAYRSHEGKDDYGTWFKNCSGGKPSRLIRLFNYYGSSRSDIVNAFLGDLMSATHSERVSQNELAFLWCLCLEKERIALHGENGIVDINKICKRLNCLGGEVPTGLVCNLFGEKTLTGACSLPVLEEYFSRATIQIPQEFFIASLGSWGHGNGCQGGIAEWIKSMLHEDEGGNLVQEYVEVTARAIFETLMCTGFLGTSSPYGDVKECITAIDGLEKHIGVFGDPELDGKTKKFLRSLKTRIGRKIIEACLDNIGFGDDANIVSVFSAILDACDEKRLFLECYAVALPLFGLLACDPSEIPAVKRFREILRTPAEKEVGEEDHLLMRALLLETAFLCSIRSRYGNIEQAKEMLEAPGTGFATRIETLAAGGDKLSSVLLQLQEHFSKSDALAFASTMKSALRLMRESQWDGLKTMIAVALTHISTSEVTIDDKVWKALLTDVGECRFPLDPENKIEKAAYFSVMMRRAFYRYRDNNSFDPWIIDVEEQSQDEWGRGETRKQVAVRLGATKRHKLLVSDLTANDLLRNLPAIVRQFAESTCAKKRGFAEYEGTLETDWRKINQIATNEKWFESINRRSRYLILFWSSKIVRDVMDEGEQRRFLSRLETMCSEVVSKNEIASNVLYRLLALQTMGNVVKDKPLLNKISAFSYKFLLDDYPRIMDRNRFEELYAWYGCVLELFNDHLGDVSDGRDPAEIFKIIVGNLTNSSVHTDADVLEAYLESPLERRERLDKAFCCMLIDIWNKRIHGVNLDASLSFVNACFDGELLKQFREQVTKIDVLDTGNEEQKALILRTISMIVALRLTNEASPDERMLDHMMFCMENCHSMREYGDIATSLKSFADCSGNPEVPKQKEFSEEYREFYKKWNEELAQEWSSRIILEFDNVEDEQCFLRDVWDAQMDVLKLLDDGSQRLLLGNLERTLELYSSKWQEGMRSDWYHAMTWVMDCGMLDKSSDKLLEKLEKLFFEGDFEKFCPEVRRNNFYLLVVLRTLAETRGKRREPQMDALAKQYSEVWASLKWALHLVEPDGSMVDGWSQKNIEEVARIDEIVKKLHE